MTSPGPIIPAWTALPFLCTLASIALGPSVARHLWHRHYGKAALLWGLSGVAGLIATTGSEATGKALIHAFFEDYLPFLLLLSSLYVVTGGIVVRGNLHGSPAVNTGVLALGAGLASVMGTTGAALVLLRPLLRANDARRSNGHVFVFFIFIVANIGGVLSPLGDPPLFLGFLRGVPFFWTTQRLWAPMLFASGVLLTVFFVLDAVLFAREGSPRSDPSPDSPLRLTGLVNLPLLGVVIAAILLSAVWRPGEIEVLGVPVGLQTLARDGTLLAVICASLALTPRGLRTENGFEWEPVAEVAILFGAIFATIIPVMALLDAGPAGPFAGLLTLVRHADGSPAPHALFWATGLLSSVLDNAPTYLVFFEAAGGDVGRLTTSLAPALVAISLGAVFMGALSYIGNAPNYMVWSIARRAGIAMPGFFGYLAWSGVVLLPLFALVDWLFVG